MEPRSPTGLYHYVVGTLRLTFTKTRYSVVKKDSEPLQMITAEFSPLMKQFHISFFWEEVPTDLGNRTVFVVKESSAAPLMYNTERSKSHPLGEEIYCYFHELTSRLQLRTQRETSTEIPADRKPVGLKDRQNFKFTRAATR